MVMIFTSFICFPFPASLLPTVCSSLSSTSPPARRSSSSKHLLDLFFFLKLDHRNFVGTVQDVWIGSGSHHPALLEQGEMQEV